MLHGSTARLASVGAASALGLLALASLSSPERAEALPERLVEVAAPPESPAPEASASPELSTLLERAPLSASAERLLDRAPRAVELRLELSTTGRDADLLLPFRDASIERLGPLRSYTSGRWGGWLSEPWHALAWSASPLSDASEASNARIDLRTPEEREPLLLAERRLVADRALVADRSWIRALEPSMPGWFDSTGPSLQSDGLDQLFRLPPPPVRDWRCRRSPVLVARAGGESQRFELVRCDGSAAPEALDRLSVLARPHDASSPGELLPELPDPAAWESAREWAPGVRVVHPRLLWVLQKLADAFPRRAIILYSGYRPYAEVNDGSGHKSLHASGRALDIAVHKTSNAEVFKACRELKDVGCGYYPYGKFVHVDVRRAAAGKAFWIDASQPGEPTRYVDAWPGVVEAGGLAWRAPD